MVKKVSLDRLDVEDPSIVTSETESDGEGETPDKHPVKWYRSRLLLALGAGFLLLCGAGGLYLFFPTAGEKETRDTASPPAAATPGDVPAKAAGSVPEKAGGSVQTGLVVETLKDFLIPFQENGKNKNVFVIDVIFEIDPAHHALFLQKISLIRASTFKALSEKAVDIVREKNGMDAARSKIIASAETLIGKDFVKNVLFSRFVVL
jgi:flagellar basal body-associated protein FliL